VASTKAPVDDYDYSYDGGDTVSVQEYPDEDLPTNSEAQEGSGDDSEPEEETKGSSIIPIIIAVCLIILLVGVGFWFAHYTKKLPDVFYNKRWKPVNTEDLVQDEEDRHPSIIKNGGLDETALTEAGDVVNVDKDLTTVTWTSDEKEDLKKDLKKEEEVKDDKIIKEEKETEKEAEKEAEKEVEKEAETAAGEEAPLKPEEN